MKTMRYTTLLSLLTFAAGTFLCGFDLSDAVKKMSPADALSVLPGGQHLSNAVKVAEAAGNAADNQFGPVEEFYLGRIVSAKLLGAYKPLPQDNPATGYLRRVGTTVAMASDAPYMYRPYTFVVLDTPEINAFAAPGGFVFVTTGMLKFLQDEDELAGILGHEIAHVELKHGTKSINEGDMTKLLATTASVAADEVNVPGAAGVAMQFSDKLIDGVSDSMRKGYNVKLEGEADRRGMDLCRTAGYDPAALVQVIARFKDTTNSYGGASYPKEREADGQKHLAELVGSSPAAASRPSERGSRYAEAVAQVLTP